MAQIKIYGIKEKLNPIKFELSAAIHACVMSALQIPENKRAHRFFPMEKEDMFIPGGRTDAYTIIEITMMEGRSETTKKTLIHYLFEFIENEIGIDQQDLEICIYECPPCNWGFRGQHGDEVELSYPVNI